jgi:SAM-dependent methyltransferase
MPVWEDSEFMARRARALDRIRENLGLGETADERKTWFEGVYDLADGDPAGVPWGDTEARAPLVRWLAEQSEDKSRGQAIDVACGLGDNAEALSSAGFETTAFDFSKKAIAWAKERFPDSRVKYEVADLLDLPRDWPGAFDLVHETYTVQALQGDMRKKAIASIAKLVAPHGRLLVITRARDEDEAAEGPPWPLERSELSAFEKFGLDLVRLDDFEEQRDRPIRHFLAEFHRP